MDVPIHTLRHIEQQLAACEEVLKRLLKHESDEQIKCLINCVGMINCQVAILAVAMQKAHVSNTGGP